MNHNSKGSQRKKISFFSVVEGTWRIKVGFSGDARMGYDVYSKKQVWVPCIIYYTQRSKVEFSVVDLQPEKQG